MKKISLFLMLVLISTFFTACSQRPHLTVDELESHVRFLASDFGDAARYRIQLGARGWLPLDDATRTIGGTSLDVLQQNLALSLGVSFEFR